MKYIVFYTGLASTPNSVGLLNMTTGEIVHEIETARPSGKETRIVFNKYRAVLVRKYESILS